METKLFCVVEVYKTLIFILFDVWQKLFNNYQIHTQFLSVIQNEVTLRNVSISPYL